MGKSLFLLLTLLFGRGLAAESHAGKDTAPRATVPCQPYPIGNQTVDGSSSYVSLAAVSPDGRTAAATFRDGTARVWNVETGKSFRIPANGKHYSQVAVGRGKVLFVGGQENGKLVDAATGTVIPTPMKFAYDHLEFSSDGKRFVTWNVGLAQIWDAESGAKVGEVAGWIEGAGLSPDGKRLLYRRPNAINLVEIGTTKEIAFPGKGDRRAIAEWSPNGKFFLTKFVGEPYVIRDGSRGHEVMTLGLDSHARPRFSADGTKVLIEGAARRQVVVDLETGRQTELPGRNNEDLVSLSPDGKRAAFLISGDSYLSVWDSASNRTTGLSLGTPGYVLAFTPDSNRVVTINHDGALVLTPVTTVCAEAREITHAEAVLPADPRWNEVCHADFKEGQWSGVEPDLKASSDAEAQHYLRRFQKPSGFNAEKHVPLLLSLLRNKELATKNGGTVRAVLENIAGYSNRLYEQLLSEVPHLLDLPLEPRAECRSIREKAAVLEGVKRYATYRRAKNRPNTVLAEWEGLRPLQLGLTELPVAFREEMIEHMAYSMRDNAAQNDIPFVFPSKLFYFSKATIDPWFGFPNREPLVDITHLQSGREISPIVLSQRPIDGSKNPNPYGYFLKTYAAIRVSSPPGKADLGEQKHLPLTAGSQRFTVTWDITVRDRDSLVAVAGAPPYEELAADGELAGVIAMSSNMSAKATPLLNQFKKFYVARGYEFSGVGLPVEGAPYFEELIRKKADYLWKEGHSDGDEKNVLRIPRKFRVQEGQKKVGGKVTERVFLLHHAPDNGSDLISNQQFGKWIQERKTSLVYVNASCTSYLKARNEIAAADRRLINLCSKGSIWTFRNEENDASWQMLNGLLKKEPYVAIRKGMEKDPEYLHRSGQTFLFPDEADYGPYVSNALTDALDVSVTLKNEATGKLLNFDEQIRHAAERP